jgi:hypothetical protein
VLTIKNISKLEGYEYHPYKIEYINTLDEMYIFSIDVADKNCIINALLKRIPQEVDGNILYSLSVNGDEHLIPKSLLLSAKSLGKHIINLLNMSDFNPPF